MDNDRDDIGPDGLTPEEHERRRRAAAGLGAETVPPRRNWLPLILAALAAIVILVLLLRGCDHDDARNTMATDETAMGDTTMTPAAGTSDGTTTVTPYERGGLATTLAGDQALPQTYELSQVTFDSGSSTLGTTAKDEIADVASALAGRSTARISLRGYADPAGDAAANQKLSQARAEAVRDALVKAGASADQIEVAALGETGDAAVRQNRRVELTATAR